MSMSAADRLAALRAAVAVGGAGHVFHRWDAAFEQLCDAATLDATDLERWRSMVEYRLAWSGMHGIQYYLLVVPEKHVVYQDRLPPGYAISPDRPVNRIRTALHPAVRRRFIYPEVALREGRRVEKTFYLTDVHWTNYGAYIGYRELLRAMAPEFPIEPIGEDELIRTRRPEFCGDMGVRLDPEPSEERVLLSVARPARFRVVHDNRAFAEGQVTVFANDDTSLPRAVIFRDSNMNAVSPFLLRHFSRTVMVGGARFFMHDLIRSEKPDIVITEMTERYLATPLPDQTHSTIYWSADLAPMTFGDFTKAELPLP